MISSEIQLARGTLTVTCRVSNLRFQVRGKSGSCRYELDNTSFVVGHSPSTRSALCDVDKSMGGMRPRSRFAGRKFC